MCACTYVYVCVSGAVPPLLILQGGDDNFVSSNVCAKPLREGKF